MTAMRSISNLHVSVGDKPILKGLRLEVPAGKAHATTGPNEAGTGHLCYVGDGGVHVRPT